MDINEILSLPAADMHRKLAKRNVSLDDINRYIKEYNVKDHDVYDSRKRQDKWIKTDKGDEPKAVARLGVPFQKIIVSRAAAFLIGDGIKLIAVTDDEGERLVHTLVKRVWKDCKLDYASRNIARKLFSETEVAELWYLKEKPGSWDSIKELKNKPKVQLRMKIMAKSLGDLLYPTFDDTGDMIAFSRQYTMQEGEKFVDYFEIYTDQYKIVLVNRDGWKEESKVAHNIGKIPVVYYKQDAPEWSDVQSLIDNYEHMISNFADCNDYFASPIMVVKGTVLGFSKKGEQGKVIELEDDGSIDLMTWDQAPEAIKLQKDILEDNIFGMTQTPNISFERMKSIGAISGTAIELLFLDAYLKSVNHQEVFGEAMQRRVNLISHMIGVITTGLDSAVKTVDITPEFEFYLPKNMKEMINVLAMATGNKQLMSVKQSMKYNPFIEGDDIEDELTELEREKREELGNTPDFIV
jgi:SPP1 family phage portal protein